ncbi:SatD family protein [Streptococcus sp. S784/96/1]|uniref:SatD family protein n=1 Tax=Streptococcus sp. S784/96/1 TaxID=2653499 RepID=UPI001387368D|nr:SatD family protein [Streptococcus sp. S784/96/1]
MVYIAIIGDVIDSKKLTTRSAVQDSLRLVLDDLNQVYADSLVSPFTLTLGDEFQALLHPHASVFQMIDSIRIKLYPVTIRFGIGIGEIVTAINPLRSIGADGPAYWNARSAIAYVHDKNDYGVTNIRVSIGDSSSENDQLVNAVLAMGEFIYAKWTDKHRDMLKVLLETKQYDEWFSHQELARHLGIEPSGLTKRLKASGLKVYLRGRKQIGEQIQAWCRQSKMEGTNGTI